MPETSERNRRSFQREFCAGTRLERVDRDSFFVDTPFLLPTGDHAPVFLRRQGDGWRLTDEGETFGELLLIAPNALQGPRLRVIEEILAAHGVRNDGGALVLPVPEGRFAPALATFIETIVEIVAVRRWSREVVRETFRADARAFLRELRPDARFDYADPVLDPEGMYPVDVFIAGRRDTAVFLVERSFGCLQAATGLLTWERRGHPLRSAVIFRNEAELGRTPRAIVGDVADMTFASLPAARERLPEWLELHAAPA